jgi:hypothetical protein
MGRHREATAYELVAPRHRAGRYTIEQTQPFKAASTLRINDPFSQSAK